MICHDVSLQIGLLMTFAIVRWAVAEGSHIGEKGFHWERALWQGDHVVFQTTCHWNILILKMQTTKPDNEWQWHKSHCAARWNWNELKNFLLAPGSVWGDFLKPFIMQSPCKSIPFQLLMTWVLPRLELENHFGSGRSGATHIPSKAARLKTYNLKSKSSLGISRMNHPLPESTFHQ